MRFILVNGRTPCRQSACALCSRPIGAGYLREIGTRLRYCDADCYVDHCLDAIEALENHVRSAKMALVGSGE